MEKLYKWVDKYEAKPLPITVSNAKKALDATRFNKFLELTGYVYRTKNPKCERRLVLENMSINQKIAVGDIKQDTNLIYSLQKDDYLFCIIDKKIITRIK